jgi:hypothetical protein
LRWRLLRGETAETLDNPRDPQEVMRMGKEMVEPLLSVVGSFKNSEFGVHETDTVEGEHEIVGAEEAGHAGG